MNASKSSPILYNSLVARRTPAPWSSPQAFCDFVGRYMDVGVNEFIFYYPSRVEQANGYYERIAREIIPNLKQTAST